jgi:hypothetical protein
MATRRLATAAPAATTVGSSVRRRRGPLAAAPPRIGAPDRSYFTAASERGSSAPRAPGDAASMRMP